MEAIAFYRSELGTIEIKGTGEGITAVDFFQGDEASISDEEGLQDHLPETVSLCIKQLDEYFKGKRTEFDLKLNPEGTAFQKKVWHELQKISYGQTASYAQIAEAAGNSKAVRAVGGANHNNKIAIIIPCHRIIGKDGSLTGYGGGLWRKEWLLEFEKKHLLT